MKIHPVRASLAVIFGGGTVAFLLYGIPIPDAWWAILGAITTFYFVSTNG